MYLSLSQLSGFLSVMKNSTSLQDFMIFSLFSYSSGDFFLIAIMYGFFFVCLFILAFLMHNVEEN